MYNNLKTLFFLTLLTGFFLALGFLFGGPRGGGAGFCVALALNMFLYWFSDTLVLAQHHAREVRLDDSQGLYEMVDRLARRGGMPTPRVYVIPDHSPNAFATGRNPYHAAIAVTEGLLGTLNYPELEGVLAHELAHIRNRDTLIGSISAMLASAIMMALSSKKERGLGALQMLLMAVFAPVAAAIVRFAVSPSREFHADAVGARLCGNPEWLANALRKIDNMSAGLPMAAGGPATAHLYIVNPFSAGAFLNFFSTHPRMEERIARLLTMKSDAVSPAVLME